MNANDRYLEDIAADFDSYGIAAVEAALAAVVDRARRAGISPVLLSVLADPTEPEIARARAFGIIATRLAQAAEQPVAEARSLVAAAY